MAGIDEASQGEWRKYWTLPVAAGLGYSTAVLYTYGMGPFFAPLEQAFGWSRVEIALGMTIAGFMGALLSPSLGILVDRIGPRKVGLIGVPAMTLSFALLGTATGGKVNWILLWVLIALANLFVNATVWSGAIASRFLRSRGLAFAVALSGASLSAAVIPVLGTWLIEQFGWRNAFYAVGLIWLAATLPMVLWKFRSPKDELAGKLVEAEVSPQAGAVLTGVEVGEALRGATLYKIILAAGLYTLTTLAIIIHLVPILAANGVAKMTAAGVASLVGLSAIAGRLLTGYLLDRLNANWVGAVVFAAPALACAALLVPGSAVWVYSAAAIIIGLTLGAEIDVLAYLTTQHLGLKKYGTLFGLVVSALGFGIALGPMLASAVYDHFGGYAYFLHFTIGAMLVSGLALATLGRPRFNTNH